MPFIYENLREATSLLFYRKITSLDVEEDKDWG